MMITAEFDELASGAIDEIKARTGMDLPKLLGYSLRLMLWSVQQLEQQRIVASVDEKTRTYRELDLDGLAVGSAASGRPRTNAA